MRKWILLFVFFALVFGVLYYITFGYYSEGKRGGFITKLSKKGYVFKTYEGELKVGGLNDGDGTIDASTWNFSVSGKNEKAIRKLEEAIGTGRRVSLTYEEKFFKLPWNGDTEYFITEVELLDAHISNSPIYQPPVRRQEASADTAAVDL